MSVGSAACLITVENVIADSLETKTIVGRSGPGKARRSIFSWMKTVPSQAEVFELFLAFRQRLYLGKMENVLTLYCTGKTLGLFWFIPITEENKRYCSEKVGVKW